MMSHCLWLHLGFELAPYYEIWYPRYAQSSHTTLTWLRYNQDDWNEHSWFAINNFKYNFIIYWHRARGVWQNIIWKYSPNVKLKGWYNLMVIFLPSSWDFKWYFSHFAGNYCSHTLQVWCRLNCNILNTLYISTTTFQGGWVVKQWWRQNHTYTAPGLCEKTFSAFFVP